MTQKPLKFNNGHCFDSYCVVKQSDAWKEFCAMYW